MKKVIVMILLMALFTSLCACKNDNISEQGNTADDVASKEILTETLSEQEARLVEYVLNIVSEEDFEDPSSVRILEVCDYRENSKYKGDAEFNSLYGPDTIVVRLQGTYVDLWDETQENPYFLIALTTDHNQSQNEFVDTQRFNMTLGYGNNYSERAWIIRYQAEAGDYTMQESYDVNTEKTTDVFRIKLLNQELTRHWEALGF